FSMRLQDLSAEFSLRLINPWILVAVLGVAAASSGSTASEESAINTETASNESAPVSSDEPVSLNESVSPNENDDPILQRQAEQSAVLRRQLEDTGEITDADPNASQKYSMRGDVQMFLGDYEPAVADYRKMVVLDPTLDASHWRLGIALFFAGKPEEAAAQFEKYHSFDNVDRENGIWRYLSHYRASGMETARKELLRYEHDDRPPFAEVYQLFEGKLTAEQLRSSLPENLTASDRQSREFYIELYIGLNELAQKHPDAALEALRRASENPWPLRAGYGPRYMWHVAQLAYCDLKKSSAARH
ncbi:MAG: tetratricopeptide repeat protein, partial [Planctomyces sp.]